MKVEVLLEDAGGNWAASSSDDILCGVVAATAPTRRKVITEFRSALRFHLEGPRETGHAVPQVTELEIRELVAA